MTPNTRAILMDLAQRMGGLYAPDLKSPYLAGSAGLTAAVLMMAAEESDRTAHRLAEENRAVRAIFDQAVKSPLPADLAERLRKFSHYAGRGVQARIGGIQPLEACSNIDSQAEHGITKRNRQARQAPSPP